MAELLLEFLSEEIPAGFQARAEADLKRLLSAALKAAGLTFETFDTYSTPRRLVAHVTGLPLETPDISEERRGPKIDAPEKAIEGFLKSVGMTRDQVEEREEKKGKFLYAMIEKKGRATAEILTDALADIVEGFPWPKSMCWAEGTLRWVRPLSGILCLFDAEKVAFKAGNIQSGIISTGHRFLAPDAFEVKDFADYRKKLKAAYVILDADERRDLIKDAAHKLAKKAGVELVTDDALIAEIAGLVEWPVPGMGSFDKSYLEVPDEVLISEMRHHQRYISCANPKTGALTNKFIYVANIEGDEDAIRQGNERVLNARLADAKFFFEQDQKTRLEDRLDRLDGIIFHAKLGTLGEKAVRIKKLASVLAASIPDCDAKLAKRAGLLAKADLVTGMVGEFPELQGVMGGYYAQHDGEHASVAQAIREHYSPRGPADNCPGQPVSMAVALADKIDTLVGFFGINELPTGSKDPYALRRAALGVIRIIVEGGLRINLNPVFDRAVDGYFDFSGDRQRVAQQVKEADQWAYADTYLRDKQGNNPLMTFIAGRLKIQMKEQGTRHDLIDAVFSLLHEDDLVRLLARVSALQDFLGSEGGSNLLAGYKRASNIVRIEEKKDGRNYSGDIVLELLKESHEQALYEGLVAAGIEVKRAVADEKFEQAMAAIAALRQPIDGFFDHVTVNIEGDAPLRENRLKLLSAIHKALSSIADFSVIEG